MDRATDERVPDQDREEVKRGSLARKLEGYLVPSATFAGLVLLWEAVVRAFDIASFIVPAPSGVAIETWGARARLIEHTWITMAETVAGFGLSLVIGIPLAVMIVYSRRMRQGLYPLLVAAQSVPKIAIAPLLLLIFGAGITSKVIIAFLVAFFPIIVGTATGLGGTPSELLDLGRLYRAGQLKLFLRVRFPLALPHVFSAMKVAITLAVIGAVVGEFVGSNVGLGYLILSATAYWNTELAFGAIVILSIMSVLLFGAVGLIERLCCPWYASDDDA